jgi:RNA binding exosome subunit
MKKLLLNNEYSSVENFRSLISGFIDELEIDSCKNEQKIIELNHVGKFLMFFENRFKIEKLSEEPDFIISDSNNRIGLEHQLLIDVQSKEKEGFWGNLIKLAEKELKKDTSLPNFLADVYAHPSFNGKINEKQKLVNEIIQILKLYVQTGELVENEIIEEIVTMEHSSISLCPNMGAWAQKELNSKLIKKAIERKEKKIDNYLKNINGPQWLLIVIDGLNDSSYRIREEFDLSINTIFEKVYILEDFRTNLYEIN